jgi:hypothetical protein
MNVSTAHALIVLARRLGKTAADLGMHAGSAHDRALNEVERGGLRVIAHELEAAALAIRAELGPEAPA